MLVFFFFFKQKTAYELRISDWSSDVCSSDLAGAVLGADDSGELDVAIILPVRPIHLIVLPVRRDEEASERKVLKIPLAVSRKGQALAVDEVDLAVDRLRREIGDTSDGPHGVIVNQEVAEERIYVRLLLPNGRLSVPDTRETRQ